MIWFTITKYRPCSVVWNQLNLPDHKKVLRSSACISTSIVLFSTLGRSFTTCAAPSLYYCVYVPMAESEQCRAARSREVKRKTSAKDRPLPSNGIWEQTRRGGPMSNLHQRGVRGRTRDLGGSVFSCPPLEWDRGSFRIDLHVSDVRLPPGFMSSPARSCRLAASSLPGLSPRCLVSFLSQAIAISSPIAFSHMQASSRFTVVGGRAVGGTAGRPALEI